MVIYSLYSFKKSLFIKFLEASLVPARQSFFPLRPSPGLRSLQGELTHSNPRWEASPQASQLRRT